jgi:hypothetical protein
MLCRGKYVSIYTLNGDLILDQKVCDNPDDTISSCAWYEGKGNEWLENSLCFTGQRGGVANVWRKAVGKGTDGKWKLELVKRLDHADNWRQGDTAVGSLAIPGGGGIRVMVDAAITCITPMEQTVYTGDEDGRVVGSFSPPVYASTILTHKQYQWDLVQRER